MDPTSRRAFPAPRLSARAPAGEGPHGVRRAALLPQRVGGQPVAGRHVRAQRGADGARPALPLRGQPDAEGAALRGRRRGDVGAPRVGGQRAPARLRGALPRARAGRRATPCSSSPTSSSTSGVGAMQEELHGDGAAWQRRRLDDESTDEIEAPVEQVETPLPDTAVLQRAVGGGRGSPDSPDAQVVAAPDGDEGAARSSSSGEITAPLVVEPAPQSQEPGGDARSRRAPAGVVGGRRGAAARRQRLPGAPGSARRAGVSGVAATDAAAGEAMLATAPRAHAGARRVSAARRPSLVSTTCSWSEDAAGPVGGARARRRAAARARSAACASRTSIRVRSSSCSARGAATRRR